MAQHIPAKPNEPLAFIQTDDTFIADHNDVFNDNVSAYLAAIVAENRYKLIPHGSSVADVDPRLPRDCQSDDFEPCFDHYQKAFKAMSGQP